MKQLNTSQKLFKFKKQRFQNPENLTLEQIQDHIAQDARKRLTKNWWFTNRNIHNATIAAINCYNQLQNKEKYHDAMQDILTSHGNYLYNPLYWITRKHILLVDGFMHDAANQRFPVTLLDLPPIYHHGAATGFLTGTLVASKDHSKK